MAASRIDRHTEPPTIHLPREYNAVTDFVDKHVGTPVADKVAYIDDRGSTTYSALAEQVNRAGNALASLSVGMETRVMLCLLDTAQFPAVFWGTLKLGGVAIPVNTLLTTADYDYMLRDSRASVLVVSAPLYEKFAAILADQPWLKTVIVDGQCDDHPMLDEILARESPQLQSAATSADDAAFWLYTSGSTGRPKGSVHLHRDLIYTAIMYGEAVLGIKTTDVVYSAAKFFFAYGLGNALSFPMYVGATTVLLSGRPTPDTVMGLLKTHQPTIFYGVPTLYGAILSDASNKRSTGSSRLRLCVSAGEALPKDLGETWEARFGAPVLDGLGSTEMLHIFVSNRPDDNCYGTSGKAVPGYVLKLLDEHGVTPKTGDIGELWVSGGSSAVAYWNQREKSLDTFHGPWTRTGDKYRIDSNGYYHYCGRTDDMLKVSGQWVSPFEVESALLTHPKVLEAAVVGQRDEQDLVKPKAIVVLQPSQAADEGLVEELKGFVKDKLAPFKYPRWIEFAENLPKTATGKIQRYKLRQ